MTRSLINVHRSVVETGVTPNGWVTRKLGDVTFLTYLTEDDRYEFEAWTGPVTLVGAPDRFEADTSRATLTSSGSTPVPEGHPLHPAGLSRVQS